MKKITISCQCETTASVSDLLDFQGDLKISTAEEEKKARASILKNGFFDPVKAWIDETGKRWIIDGHQRVKAVKNLLSSGYTLEGNALPVIWVEAANLQEAKGKVLAAASQYAGISKDGFSNFLRESAIKAENIAAFTNLNNVDIEAIIQQMKENSRPLHEVLASIKAPQKSNFQTMTFIVSAQQAEVIHRAVKKAKTLLDVKNSENKNGNGNGLAIIAESFLKNG